MAVDEQVTSALGTWTGHGAPPAPIRHIGGVAVSMTGRAQALAAIHGAIAEGRHDVFGFCNAHTVNLARRSSSFAASLRRARLFNDGIGIDLASRLLYGSPFVDNLNGTDLTPQVLAGMTPDQPVFFIGSAPGVAAAAAEAIVARFPNVTIAGTEHGFNPIEAEPAVAERIRRSGARLVLAGMGQPHQEFWAERNARETGAVILCVGAFLDFTAGRVRRAPGWMRAARVEWLYRLALEPRRMAGRYLVGNAAFLAAVLRQRLAR